MKGIHEHNFVENFLSNRLILHNALFEFLELGFSQDFAHFSNCRVLYAVSCHFFSSAKIFVSKLGTCKSYSSLFSETQF